MAALVPEPDRWHNPSMKTRTAAAAARKHLVPFRKGQVWRIGDINLAVTSVGKTLVHYKRYRTQPRGIQTTLSSKPDLQTYLIDSGAVLASD